MGVLDTFFILFKTDADEAAAKTRKLGDATDDVEKKLAKTDATAARLSGSFLGMAAALAAPLIALVSFSGAINTVFARIEEIGNIGDASLKLRSTAADYDAFTRAVRASGGNMADAQANLAKFSDKLNDAAARPDGPNAKNFAKWGIKFKDVKGEALGAVDGLLALSKSLENVSKAEALGRLRRLGIEDADTIDFLLQGKQAIIDKMDAEKRAGVVTDRQVELEGQYQSAVGKTRNMLDTFASMITEAVLPSLIGLYRGFSSALGWMLENRTLVEGFFIGVAAAVTVFFLPAMTAAAAAVIAATWPFLLIVGAVAAVGAAFALAYEDVRAFMDGQPSLIGELAERYQWFGDIVRGIGEAYKWLQGAVEATIDGSIQAWGMFVDAVKQAWAAMQPVFDAIGQGANAVKDVFLEIYTPIYDAWSNLFSALGELAVALFGRIRADLSQIVGVWGDRLREIGSNMADTFAGLAAALNPFKDDVQAAANVIAEIFRVMAGIIKSVWKDAIGFLADQVNWVAEKIRGVLSTLSGGVTVPLRTDTVGGAPAPVSPPGVTSTTRPLPTTGAAAAGATMGSMFKPPGATPGGSPYPTNGAVARAQGLLEGAGNSPMGTATPGSIAAANSPVTNTSTVEIGKVEVHTQATDAKGVASAVRSELQNQLRGTAAQFDDGVDR